MQRVLIILTSKFNNLAGYGILILIKLNDSNYNIITIKEKSYYDIPFVMLVADE